MGKALVMYGANFSTNCLDTIEFADDIACTGITLSQSSISLTSIGSTNSLVATTTPANTTDSILWTSSNPSIVSVNNGTVTQLGVGSVTITATCGENSATCTVTATNVLVYEYWLSRNNYNMQKDDATKDYIYGEPSSESYCAVQSTVATDKAIWNSNKESQGLRYPFLLGTGATQVSIVLPSTMRCCLWFVDSKTACTYSDTHSTYAVYAKVISGDASAYDKTVPLGNRTVSVPAGADAVVFSLQYPSGTITDEIMQGVTFTVS